MPIILYGLAGALIPIAAVMGFKAKTAANQTQQTQQQQSGMIDLVAFAAGSYLVLHMLKKGA